jgi:hypothetical protein
MGRDETEDGRDGWEEDDGDESRKPKRLDESIVSYLISLEANLSGTDIDSLEAIVTNVLLELKNCTASAACDRRTNSIVEKICLTCNIDNIIELFTRFTDYSVFLARNRHSSHVLQSLMSRLCFLLKTYHISGTDEENPLIEAFSSFSLPILKELNWLARDMSASHVVRSIFCVLTGIPVISERKGKGSKHKNTVPLSETLGSLLHAKSFYVSQEFTFYVPPVFHDMFKNSIETLCILPTAELQDLVADQGSSSFLGLVIRILMNPSIIVDGPELGEKLIRQALNWSEDDNGEVTGAPIFYGMSADKAGSYFLEASIESGPLSFFLDCCNHAVIGRSIEYAQDGTANFVLQAILRRLSTILSKSRDKDAPKDDSGGIPKGGKRYKKVVEICKTFLEELLIVDVFHGLATKCAGVILWMLELTKYMPTRDGGNEWGQKVAGTLLNLWCVESNGNDNGTGNNVDDDNNTILINILSERFKPKQKENDIIDDNTKKSKDKKLNKYAAASEAAKKETNKEHDSRQLLLSRLVGAILQLNDTKAAKKLSNALSQITQEALHNIATSGPISRSVMDILLDNASKDDISTILDTLQPCIIALAGNFLGQHVVRRIFEKAEIDDKIALANILQFEMKELKKTKEGQASLRVCQIDMLNRQPEEWHRMIKRQARGAQLVDELVGESESYKQEQDNKTIAFESTKHHRNDETQSKSQNNYDIGKKVSSWAIEESTTSEKKRKRKSDNNQSYGRNNNIYEDNIGNKKDKKTDYEKISRLRGANLGLNLQAEVENLQRERKERK